MTAIRAMPPVWLIGLTVGPVGIIGAALTITVPQLLAAQLLRRSDEFVRQIAAMTH
jgi:hypothetical protein